MKITNDPKSPLPQQVEQPRTDTPAVSAPETTSAPAPLGLEVALTAPLAPLQPSAETAAPLAAQAKHVKDTADLETAKARLAALTDTITGPPTGEIAKPYELAFAAAEKFVSIGSLLSSQFVIGTFTSELPANPSARARVEQRSEALKTLLGGGEAKVAEQFLSTAPAPLAQLTATLIARVQPAFSEFMRSTRMASGASKKQSDVEIPSPTIVALERASLGLSFDGDMDVESLAILVMSQCSRDSDIELRDVLSEMNENRKKKEAMRAQINAFKEMKNAFEARQRGLDAQMLDEYRERQGLDPANERFIPSTVSFEDFKAQTNIRVIGGTLAEAPFDGTLGMGSETLFPYSPAAPTTGPTSAGEVGGTPPPWVSPDTPITPADKLLQTKYNLKDEDIRALRALYDAAPAPKGTSFESWLDGLNAGELPSPSLAATGNNSDKTKAFLTEIANGSKGAAARTAAESAVASQADNYESIKQQIDNDWKPAQGGTVVQRENRRGQVKTAATNAQNAIKDYGDKFLVPAEARTALDSALREYYAALAQQAWGKRNNLNDSQMSTINSRVDTTKATLNTALGAFGDKRGYANNYVALNLKVALYTENHMGHYWAPSDDLEWVYGNLGKSDAFPANAFYHRNSEGVEGRGVQVAWTTVPGQGGKWLHGDDHKKLAEAVSGAMSEFTGSTVKTPDPKYPAWTNATSLKDVAARHPAGYTTTQPPPAPTAPTVAAKEEDAPATIAARAFKRPNIGQDEIRYGDLASTAERMKAQQEKLQTDMDTLNDLTSEAQTRVQLYMDRRSKFQTTLSNLLKKASDTASAIIGNIK